MKQIGTPICVPATMLNLTCWPPNSFRLFQAESGKSWLLRKILVSDLAVCRYHTWLKSSCSELHGYTYPPDKCVCVCVKLCSKETPPHCDVHRARRPAGGHSTSLDCVQKSYQWSGISSLARCRFSDQNSPLLYYCTRIFRLFQVVRLVQRVPVADPSPCRSYH